MNVLYFAWVRQKVGRAEETIEHVPALRTVGDLAQMLAARGGGYAEALADMRRLRAAVNQVHVGLEIEVQVVEISLPAAFVGQK